MNTNNLENDPQCRIKRNYQILSQESLASVEVSPLQQAKIKILESLIKQHCCAKGCKAKQ